MVIGYDCLSKFKAKMECEENRFSVRFESGGVEKRIASISIEHAREELNRLLTAYEGLFTNKIGKCNNYEYEIETTTNKAFKAKTYPIPDAHIKEVRKHMRELEKDGIISKRATQYINPLVVVIKKNKEIRLCLDARELNKRI